MCQKINHHMMLDNDSHTFSVLWYFWSFSEHCLQLDEVQKATLSDSIIFPSLHKTCCLWFPVQLLFNLARSGFTSCFPFLMLPSYRHPCTETIWDRASSIKIYQFQVTCQVFVHDHLVTLPPLVKRIPLKIIKQKYEVSYRESEGGDTN